MKYSPGHTNRILVALNHDWKTTHQLAAESRIAPTRLGFEILPLIEQGHCEQRKVVLREGKKAQAQYRRRTA
jgi:hypothetical protein